MEVYGTKTQVPGNLDAFDDLLITQRVSLLAPQGGGTPSSLSFANTTLGTLSHPAISASTYKTRANRWLVTSAATAAAVIGNRSSTPEFSRDIGFTAVFVGGISILVAGQRWFMGLTDSVSAPTNVDPLTITAPGKIGLAFNTNSGNLNLVHCVSGTAPTVLDLGASFPVNTSDVWELRLWALPAATGIKYTVINRSTGASTSGSLSTNIPAAATMLGKSVWTTNNATAAACAFDMMRLYSRSNN